MLDGLAGFASRTVEASALILPTFSERDRPREGLLDPVEDALDAFELTLLRLDPAPAVGLGAAE